MVELPEEETVATGEQQTGEQRAMRLATGKVLRQLVSPRYTALRFIFEFFCVRIIVQLIRSSVLKF